MTKELEVKQLLQELYGDVSPAEEAAMMDVFASSGAALPPMMPRAGLKARILRSVERPRHAFVDRVARLLDLSMQRAREVLDKFDDMVGWEAAGPGVMLFHLEAGPRLSGAVVGLVRVDAGILFPRHSHIGEEMVLVLQGGIRDESGQVFLPGDIAYMSAGSEHEFTALPGNELAYLAVVHEGVDFSPSGGPVILPRS